jgi:ribosome biogenesis ATPase
VRRFVEEQATDEPVLQLRLSAIYAYIANDPSIARQKKAHIEKSIERALDVIREEDADDDELDSEFDGLDEDSLMIPDIIESNAVNKRITEMWSGKSGGAIGTPAESRSRQGTPARETRQGTPMREEKTTVVETVVTTEGAVAAPVAASPKRKRKAKEEEGKAKRQKAEKENRDPPKNVFLKDLGGIDDAVNQLLEFVAFPLMHPEVYEYTGVPIPRGVLLHGPPGCGKTFLANALAGELGLPFIPISAPSIVSGMSGESEKKLRELFEEAREKAPCLMFIDEIDAITPKRESAQREMERRIVAQMLTCMDGQLFTKRSLASPNNY